MSKRKKIFHKPDEQVPSADDILNYLNEENSSLPPSVEKSSPSGGALKKRRSSKPELDGLSQDEFLSESKNKKKEKDEEESEMPKPSFSAVQPVISYGGIGAENSEEHKKKHAFEKKMLAEPLVSDAVEGYALIKDKKKAKTILEEINQSIASQTSDKNSKGIFMRIAAILVILFLVSGGSFYLFEQFSSGEMEAVSKNASTTPAATLDTVRQAAIDSVVKQEQLAIETDKTFIDKDKMPGQSKPVTSDGYLSEPLTANEPGARGGNGYGNSTPLVVMEKEQAFLQSNLTDQNIAADTTAALPNDELALLADDMKNETKKDASKERKKEGSKDRAATAKSGTHYAPPSPKLSETAEEEQPSGKIKKTYLLEDGIRLYNEGKYKEAEEIFAGLLMTQPSNQEAIFYSGMSDYKMQLYDRALSYLPKVIPASRRYDEARWTISLIYLETGRKDEAIELWKTLSKSNNSYSEKAFEKLKEYSK